MTPDRLREIETTLHEEGAIACAPYVPQLLAEVERLERENAELLAKVANPEPDIWEDVYSGPEGRERAASDAADLKSYRWAQDLLKHIKNNPLKDGPEIA